MKEPTEMRTERITISTGVNLITSRKKGKPGAL